MLTDGQVIGGCRLKRQLGRGAFGEVWLADHIELGIQRALKIPTDAEFVRQLRTEGRIQVNLQHPHIVQVFDLNTQQSPPYIVMEYVEGENLRQRLNRDGKLKEPDALNILRQILEALEFAHSQGVLHRDLKPENILLTQDGGVKIVDFGLGKVQAEVAQSLILSGSMMTKEGQSVSGTYEYMSPEQKAAKTPDVRDDLYAVGIIGCELLTGNRPAASGLARALERAGIGAELANVLERVCDDLEHRLPNAKTLRNELNALGRAGLRSDEADSKNTPQKHRKARRMLDEVASSLREQEKQVEDEKNNETKTKRLQAMARGRRRKAFQVDYAKYQEILATPRATEAIKKDAWSGLCQQWQIANQSAEPGELAWATDCPIQVFPGAVRVIVLGKGKTLDLCWIPPGEFQMGTRGFWGRVNGERIHQVKINRGFWIGKYPVTQEQYEAVMGNNPSKFKSTQNPVEQVNWNDAVAFCQKIKARLPREAEWEYACRAGTTTKFSSSDSDSDLGRVGWYIDNSNSQTHPVGQKQGNFWGLYDMHGNVSEWCSDWYGKNYYKQSPTSGPKGPTDGSDRVLRGGAWNSYPISCRSAFRSNGNPSYHCNNVGFRVCLDE